MTLPPFQKSIGVNWSSIEMAINRARAWRLENQKQKSGRMAQDYTASTVSLNPMALVKATSVESRGLLRTDKAL